MVQQIIHFSIGVVFSELYSLRHLVTLGWSENLVCFKNITTSFDYSWINAPFEPPASEKREIVNIDDALIAPSESWKTIELSRLAELEYDHYERQLKGMKQDLERIKSTVIHYMDINMVKSSEEQFPMQFFNLNATEADLQSGALKELIETKRQCLEKIFEDEKTRILNIKQIMWDHFETKPLEMRAIFTNIFIQNYPLTDLDMKLGDEVVLTQVLQSEDLFKQIGALKLWIIQNHVDQEDIKWPVANTQANKYNERFSAFASKIIDQNLSANVNLDLNFFSTLPTESIDLDINEEASVNSFSIRIYVSL